MSLHLSQFSHTSDCLQTLISLFATHQSLSSLDQQGWFQQSQSLELATKQFNTRIGLTSITTPSFAISNPNNIQLFLFWTLPHKIRTITNEASKVQLVSLPCAPINLVLPLFTTTFDAPPPNFFFFFSSLSFTLDLKEVDT